MLKTKMGSLNFHKRKASKQATMIYFPASIYTSVRNQASWNKNNLYVFQPVLQQLQEKQMPAKHI